jgi:adenylyltransferase/sulfurtransferase
MSATVQVPTPLRRFTGDAGEVTVPAGTVGEALRSLVEQHPQLERHLYGDDGKLRSFVNIFLNDEDVRYLKQEDTAVGDGDTLAIIPSIAGGSVAEAIPPGTATEVELSQEEIQRYSRHLIMPEVGIEGQKKLKQARVLMIGTGGLGSPLGLYLAAAGVGTLGIVDFDVVDESNLQRQVLYSKSDVGRPKIEAAAERLRGINHHIKLEPHETRLESSNALDLFKDYDLVVDGTDNFPTRYLVNDACVLLGKPNVYGSIFRFEGQVSIFWGEKGPCYRCLFAEPPPPGLVPSCAEGGVLGVLPGIVGALQANEVIKLILGAGDPMIGRLLLFDALGMKFRELKLRKNPECPVCSENPTQTELIDYQQFCGVGAEEEHPEGIDIDVHTLNEWLESGRHFTLLDVRTPQERAIAEIPGSRLIPVQDIPDRHHELDKNEHIIVHCHHGPRSTQVTLFLRDKGYEKVWNLSGGIHGWSLHIDPAVPRY